MKRLLCAGIMSVLAVPALAGGGSGTYTSYSAPVVQTVYESGRSIVLGGYRIPTCMCDCNGNVQMAVNIATTVVVEPASSVRRLTVWSN